MASRNAMKAPTLLLPKPVKKFATDKDERVFKKGEKLRKRFKCTEVKTGRVYLFSPVYEVEIMN